MFFIINPNNCYLESAKSKFYPSNSDKDVVLDKKGLYYVLNTDTLTIDSMRYEHIVSHAKEVIYPQLDKDSVNKGILVLKPELFDIGDYCVRRVRNLPCYNDKIVVDRSGSKLLIHRRPYDLHVKYLGANEAVVMMSNTRLGVLKLVDFSVLLSRGIKASLCYFFVIDNLFVVRATIGYKAVCGGKPKYVSEQLTLLFSSYNGDFIHACASNPDRLSLAISPKVDDDIKSAYLSYLALKDEAIY